MIQSISIKNPIGNTLVLNLRTSAIDEGLLVFSIDGFGSPNAPIVGTAGPNMDGFLYYFSKAGARYITLTLAVPPGVSEETSKEKIYDYFPVKRDIVLTVVTETRTVYITARVEQVKMNQFSKVENAEITLSCPRPYFIDGTEKSVNILDTGTVINYAGDADVGGLFTISFTGNIGTPSMWISNASYSQLMDLDFTNVLAVIGGSQYTLNGDQVLIDTRFGQKSATYIRSSVSYNMVSGVGMSSDWIRLGLDSSIANNMGWSSTDGPSGNSYIGVNLKYREEYHGV